MSTIFAILQRRENTLGDSPPAAMALCRVLGLFFAVAGVLLFTGVVPVPRAPAATGENLPPRAVFPYIFPVIQFLEDAFSYVVPPNLYLLKQLCGTWTHVGGRRDDADRFAEFLSRYFLWSFCSIYFFFDSGSKVRPFVGWFCLLLQAPFTPSCCLRSRSWTLRR